MSSVLLAKKRAFHGLERPFLSGTCYSTSAHFRGNHPHMRGVARGTLDGPDWTVRSGNTPARSTAVHSSHAYRRRSSGTSASLIASITLAVSPPQQLLFHDFGFGVVHAVEALRCLCLPAALAEQTEQVAAKAPTTYCIVRGGADG